MTRLLEDPADLKKDYPGGLPEAHEPFESGSRGQSLQAAKGKPRGEPPGEGRPLGAES